MEPDSPPKDEVIVFQDKAGDGTYGTRSVFYAATEAAMDLELGPDGWICLAERDRVLRDLLTFLETSKGASAR